MNRTRGLLEWSLRTATIIAFAWACRRMLAGQARFVGDPEYWYALYHYFAEGLYNNTLALWNPYMNGGEPFWPTFGMFRLIDPLNVLLILVGRVFGLSIFYLYHIQFLLKVAVSL